MPCEDLRINRFNEVAATGVVCDREGELVGGWFLCCRAPSILAWLVVMMQEI